MNEVTKILVSSNRDVFMKIVTHYYAYTIPVTIDTIRDRGSFFSFLDFPDNYLSICDITDVYIVLGGRTQKLFTFTVIY